MSATKFKENTLYYGDNLAWMERWNAEACADLIYLDPPFNSNEDYNVLFGRSGNGAPAQVKAFQDTWRWGEQAVFDLGKALALGDELAKTMRAFQTALSQSPMLAYLCHLAPRLALMRKLLKPAGSIYLHCDDTAGSYIKLLMDAIFGPENHRNTIIWRRAVAHNDASRFGRISDMIHFYSRGENPYWNGEAITTPKSEEELASEYPSRDSRGRFCVGNITVPWYGMSEEGGAMLPWKGYDVYAMGRCWFAPRTGKYAEYIEQHIIPGYREIEGVHKRLDALDEAGLIYRPEEGHLPGVKLYADADRVNLPQDLILDPIGFTNYSKGSEYLDYPTQKPQALLRKLIDVACPPGGLVLDPYCGCGAAIHVAQETRRPWVGIDVTHLAITLIEQRFKERLGISPRVVGLPEDMPGARDLFARDPFQFESWAVSRIPGISPNEVQRGDRGIDGRGYAHEGHEKSHLVLVQVKGGKRVGPSAVRDLRGTMTRERAALGILVVMDDDAITRGVREELAQEPVTISGEMYPDIQSWTIKDFFDGKFPRLPAMQHEFRGRPRDWVDDAIG